MDVWYTTASPAGFSVTVGTITVGASVGVSTAEKGAWDVAGVPTGVCVAAFCALMPWGKCPGAAGAAVGFGVGVYADTGGCVADSGAGVAAASVVGAGVVWAACTAVAALGSGVERGM